MPAKGCLTKYTSDEGDVRPSASVPLMRPSNNFARDSSGAAREDANAAFNSALLLVSQDSPTCCFCSF